MYLSKYENKIKINIVFLGHLDSGKSSIIGNLLYKQLDLSKSSEFYFKSVDKSGSINYIWLVDRTDEERSGNLTITVANYKFVTDKYYFTCINIPGHRKLMKHTIKGISQGDYGVLVISAPKGEFEIGMSKDFAYEGQTRQHAIAAFAFGIRKLIVVINKMDEYSVNYSQERYNLIVEQVSNLLKKIGYKDVENFPFIPISTKTKENLFHIDQTNQKLSWYKGVSLLEALEQLKEPVRYNEKPFRFAISDVFRIPGIGTVIIGKIETGIAHAGYSVYFSPSFYCREIKSIEKHHYDNFCKYYGGDIIGINISNMSKRDIHPGDILGETKAGVPCKTNTFNAHILVLRHPTPIKKGDQFTFNCHSVQTSCIISEIFEKFDKTSTKQTNDAEINVYPTESAIVKITTSKFICVETYEEFPPLGRIILRNKGLIVAFGIIKSVEQIKKTNQNYNG